MHMPWYIHALEKQGMACVSWWYYPNTIKPIVAHYPTSTLAPNSNIMLLYYNNWLFIFYKKHVQHFCCTNLLNVICFRRIIVTFVSAPLTQCGFIQVCNKHVNAYAMYTASEILAHCNNIYMQQHLAVTRDFIQQNLNKQCFILE